MCFLNDFMDVIVMPERLFTTQEVSLSVWFAIVTGTCIEFLISFVFGSFVLGEYRIFWGLG